MSARLAALRQELARAYPQADALVVSGDADRRYLSGFRGDSGVLWITRDDAALITDARFWEQAERECPPWRLVRQQGPLAPALAGVAAEAGARAVAFQPEPVSYAVYRSWRHALVGVRLVAASGLLDGLRLRKDPQELAAIRRAAAMTDAVFAQWLPQCRAGAVEAELALDLEVRLRRAGAEGMAFPPIVAAGPRGAMAHAIAGPERLASGDLVVVDVGARVDGYCSDMTRTVVVSGAAPPLEALAARALVAEALRVGVAALRPGVGAVGVDALVRQVIVAGGYGDHFGHGTGHGVGLDVHEPPRISPHGDPQARIPQGAVVTIEPGVYVPGRFGVRLEQLVYVGPDGPELLSQSPLEV